MDFRRDSDSPSGASEPIVRLTFEHTHRELLPSMLLLHELDARGLSWRFDNVFRIGAPVGEREVMVLPFFHGDSDPGRFLRHHGVLGHPVVNLTYEQFYCTELAEGWVRPAPGIATEEVLHCAWGDRTKNRLLASGIDASRVVLTGQPRFDLYDTPHLLRSREELASRFGLDPDKRWVLIPYSFGGAFSGGRRARRLSRRGYAFPEEMVDVTRRALTAFNRMIPGLADRHRDVEFIVRAHPSGYDVAGLREQQQRRQPNVRVISELDIAHWIVQSSLVVVWISSSGIEALVAGVPVVALDPEGFDDRFGYDVTRILPTVRSADRVERLLDEIDRSPLRPDWSLFDEWFTARGGGSARRIADALTEVAADYDRWAVRGDPGITVGQRVRRRANELAEHAPTAFAPTLERLGWRRDPPNISMEDRELVGAISTLDGRRLEDGLG